jgi:chemotaxis protein methyltransferase CheR
MNQDGPDLWLANGLPALEESDFRRLCELVRVHTGIHLGPDKLKLMQARIGKRLRALNLTTYREYLAFLDAPENAPELEFFSNVVTTNKTSFFREPHHFQFLADTWLPELRARTDAGASRRIRIWSAGSSSGEEVYSIAITLLQALGSAASGFDIRLLASDINTHVLEAGRQGVYSRDKVEEIPQLMLYRWFLQGTGAKADFVCLRNEVRQLVTFRAINFVEPTWPIHTRFDVIFCRNALIYFDRESQERILRHFLKFLVPGGYLILGHSECIHGWIPELDPIGQTIYRSPGGPEIGTHAQAGRRSSSKDPHVQS